MPEEKAKKNLVQRLEKKIARLHRNHGENLAKCYALLNAFICAVYSLLAHEYSPETSSYQIGFFGCLTPFLFGLTLTILREKTFLPISRSGRKALAARCIGGVFFLNLYIFFSRNLPASKFIVLLNTNAILSVLLGPIFAGEKPDIVAYLLAFASLFGIVLIIDPSILGFSVETSSADDVPFALLISGFSLPICSVSLNFLLKNFMSRMTPTHSSMGYSFTSVLLFGLLGLTKGCKPIALKDYLLTQAFAISTIVGHYLFVVGIGLAKKASTIILINSSQVIITFLLSATFVGGKISFLNFVGLLVFFGSVLGIGIYEMVFAKEGFLRHTVMLTQAWDDEGSGKDNENDEEDDEKRYTSLQLLVDQN